MATYVVRVWLPDRPGALGAVASRIGAVRGDLVGIDILERGAGVAIDELLVDLASDDLLPLMVGEISQVDGVEVEDVRLLPSTQLPDARLDALESAAALVGEEDVEGLLATFAGHARHDFEADWAAVIDLEGPVVLAGDGDVPPTAWLAAFVAGSRSSVAVAVGDSGPDDIAWASLPMSDLAVVLGRSGRPLRARERRQLTALSRIADARWRELATRPARRTHPSSGPAAVTTA